MRFLKRLMAPKEIKILLGALEAAEYKLEINSIPYMFREPVIPFVKRLVENSVFSGRDNLIKEIQTRVDPRIIIYDLISQIAADYCCYGPFVVFGIFSDKGKEMHRVFEQSIDELVTLNNIKESEAIEAKKVIKDAIAARR